MKLLENIRLVQWYHFQDETMPIGGSCILLGDNGSGKTTVLDAIQIALVADFSEILLNRAANEKSRRALYGYVRWKIGSEDESRPGEVRYGRRSCSSYVMLEFSDDQNNSCFTCGVGFEATETDTEVPKLFFVVPDAKVADVEVVTSLVDGQRVVRPLREVKTWLRMRGGKCWQDSGTYREELRQRLGALPESFHRLIVKALAFKPIGQVRQFVFDYLLDDRPINTVALQSNLEHYKRLEGEAQEAEKRIAELDEIVREGERIITEQRTAESHQYMELQADMESSQIKVAELEGGIAQHRADLQLLLTRKKNIPEELRQITHELERLRKLLEGHEVYQHLIELERQIDDTRRNLSEAEDADQRARKLLLLQTEALDSLFTEQSRELKRLRPTLFEKGDLLGAEEPPEVVVRLRSTLASEGALTGRDLRTWEKQLVRAADQSRQARLVLEKESNNAKSERMALQEELRTLDAGRQRYPDGPAALLHLLSARLKGRRDPKPLCELIEVPNARWRDAVEGYLNTRRFDVIVAPEDYPRALSLYERHKRDYALPGRGNIFIASVGLVDIDRMMRITPRCESRSLAEQVDTKDAYARLYCDFVLGDVICVDDEQSLRKHKAAITDTVMIYRNHVARQTARDIFSRHYIGEAARRRRLEEIVGRLAELHQDASQIAAHCTFLKELVPLLDEARAEARRLPDLIEKAESLEWLKLQVRRLEEQKNKIDRSQIKDLEDSRAEGLKRQDVLVDEQKKIEHRSGKLEEKIEQGEKDLEARKNERSSHEKALSDFSEQRDEQLRQSYEQRYARERTERSPEQIHEVFEKQRRTIETRVAKLTEKLIDLKARYVERHGVMISAAGTEFEEFKIELEAWRESKLPLYREKISEAKTKALQQLAEDIVFRLRENLLLVRRQIDDLNRALEDVPFGSERYEFKVEVEPEHRDFYSIVMDAGRFEKESLFGEAAMTSPELRATLANLLDRLIEAEAKEVKTELEAKADYREYFRYDLKIIHADGHYSLYDKVSGDKSGGETQTPYYIAILASMYRLYRSRSLNDRPLCGIVLLDEAFGKMDEPRITATLAFARNLGLQLILATPKERSEMVAPAVERSIFIHKDAVSGIPTVMDFTKEFARDERDDLRASGTAFTAAGSP
jgi:uncharacterized protein YPO0396